MLGEENESVYDLKKELLKVKLNGLTCPKCNKVLKERKIEGEHSLYL